MLNDFSFDLPDEKEVRQDEPDTPPVIDSRASTPILSAPRRRRQRKGVYIPLTDSGDVDQARVKDEDRERVDALTRSQKQAQANAAEQWSLVIPPMYRLLGALEAWLATRATGLSQEKTRDIFTYSPEEIEALSTPTANVLSKYAGSLLDKSDELALLFTLATIHQQKIYALQQAQKEKVSA